MAKGKMTKGKMGKGEMAKIGGEMAKIGGEMAKGELGKGEMGINRQNHLSKKNRKNTSTPTLAQFILKKKRKPRSIKGII
jgi:hypothetical protein